MAVNLKMEIKEKKYTGLKLAKSLDLMGKCVDGTVLQRKVRYD